MFSIALVGAGAHSTAHHAPALQRFALEHPDALSLAAVCDLDPERAERARVRFGFQRAFTRLEELLAETPIDAAVLTVPVPAILPVAQAMDGKGIPLLIEKPLGTDLAQARALREWARRATAPVIVSLNRRFDPGLNLALAWARKQGPIRFVHGSMLRAGRLEPEFVWGTGIHLLDAMCYVAGPLTLPEGAAAPAGPGGCWRVARLAGPDGLAASLEILPSCGRVEERLRLAGDHYCLDVWTGSSHPWRVEVWLGGKQAFVREAAPEEPAWVSSGAWAETEAFLGALLAGRRPVGPTPEDAWPATELAARLAEPTD